MGPGPFIFLGASGVFRRRAPPPKKKCRANRRGSRRRRSPRERPTAPKPRFFPTRETASINSGSARGEKMGGWIYCFVTPSMPGVVKIGATDRDPTERLREAMACTWHLPDYAIACAVEVEEPFAAERRIHAALALRRVHPRREFFRATADEARTLIALTTTVGQTAESADVTRIPPRFRAQRAALPRRRRH
jgi:hypothetical protein